MARLGVPAAVALGDAYGIHRPTLHRRDADSYTDLLVAYWSQVVRVVESEEDRP